MNGREDFVMGAGQGLQIYAFDVDFKHVKDREHPALR